MKKKISNFKKYFLLLGLVPAFFTGCIDPNANSYPNNSYGTGYGSGGYNSGPSYGYGDPYNRERREIEHDRREADRDRRQAEEDRYRIEAERRRLEAERARTYNTPPPPRNESCPSGFSPSERKCSSDERKRGCRDMRLPGGLGCVSR